MTRVQICEKQQEENSLLYNHVVPKSFLKREKEKGE